MTSAPMTSAASAALGALRDPAANADPERVARPPAVLDTAELRQVRTVARDRAADVARLRKAHASAKALREQIGSGSSDALQRSAIVSAIAAVSAVEADLSAATAAEATAVAALSAVSESLRASIGGREDRRWDLYGAHIWHVYLDRLVVAGAADIPAAQLAAGNGVRVLQDAHGSLTVVPAEALKAMGFAWQQIGKPYLWGGNGPDRFDCSGLTQQAWLSAGIAVPRVSRDQWSVLKPTPIDERAPGDEVFYANAKNGIHHVGFYLAPGLLLNAPFTGTTVRVEPVWQGDYGSGRPWLDRRRAVRAPTPLVPYYGDGLEPDAPSSLSPVPSTSAAPASAAPASAAPASAPARAPSPASPAASTPSPAPSAPMASQSSTP